MSKSIVPIETSKAIYVCETAILAAARQLEMAANSTRIEFLNEKIRRQVLVMLMAISVGARQDARKTK